VLAAETWLADIAQNVAGERVHVDTLLSPGVDPHEFQPAPQDAIRIAQANVLIVNGLGYETWLSKSLQNADSNTQVVEAFTGPALFTPRQPDADPHAWMNPLLVRNYVQHIRNALDQIDPAGKQVYDENAAAYIQKLNALDTSIKIQVAQIPPEKRLLVTSHDSLGYFAAAYGFQIVGAVIPSVSSEASPSAQHMAALINTIQRTKAPAIFLDASENRNLAQQIASSTGAKVVSDLYVETLSASGGPAATYVDMMQHDASAIVGALK
jgi:zinc/manganese transport system substrate-binding protein